MYFKKFNSKGVILIGLSFILIIFNLFYYEFLTYKSSSELDIQSTISNWSSFGSYFGGVLAPICQTQ